MTWFDIMQLSACAILAVEIVALCWAMHQNRRSLHRMLATQKAMEEVIRTYDMLVVDLQETKAALADRLWPFR